MDGAAAAVGFVLVKRDAEDAKRIQVRFDALPSGEVRTMHRVSDEALEKTLARVVKLFGSKDSRAKAPRGHHNKRGRHGRTDEGGRGTDSAQAQKDLAEGAARAEHATELVAVLDEEGQALAGDLSNETALLKLGKRVVVAGVGSYAILVNPPAILSLSVKGRPIVGCPLAPVVELEFAEHVPQTWTWVAQPPAGPEGAIKGPAAVVGHSRVYTPTEADVGMLLSVSCELRDVEAASQAAAEAEGPTIACPDRAALLARQRDFGTPTATSDGALRVVSYNTLADAYSHTWDGMYAYCAVEHRAIEYRLPLLLREVADYNADLICLQEVDSKVYGTWAAFLEAAGLEGRFTPKAGTAVREGCAMFWRKDKLTCRSFESVEFRELVRGCEAGWLLELTRAVEELGFVMQQVTTVAQVGVFSYTNSAGGALDGRRIVLSNTHSFFHPGAGSVRAVQAKLLTGLVNAAARREQDTGGASRVAVLMCGDMNAQSFDLSMQFLLKGRVGAEHSEWATSSLFRWDSKANLARDTVFKEDGDTKRYPNVLLQKTPSGRLRSVDELEAQVEAVDLAHSWTDKINVVAELRDVLALSQDLERADDCKRLQVLLERMSEHLEVSRRRLVAEQAEAVARSGRASEADIAIGVGANLVHNLGLVSACGEPAFTNYCGSWAGDIDWILVSKTELSCLAFAPLPTEAEVSRDVALPSVRFPSDHLSLCCELAWREAS